MRKLFVGAVAALLLSPVAAQAASPHFNSASATVSASSASLVVAAQVTGLGGNQNVSWSISNSAVTVTAGCKNKSGGFPSGTQKFAGSLYFDLSGSASADKNGNVTISKTFSPTWSTVAACPSGQRWTVVSVDSNSQVTITVTYLGGSVSTSTYVKLGA